MRRALLRWYGRAQRPLAWRKTGDPYRIWVSEIMLQQTTVKTVIPYYERFLKRFPDIRSLAAAREGAVLKAWAGLGYYSRARNLRAAAKKIVAGHGGTFPDNYDDVLALPGVGRYTAGAVLSIAFQKPYAVLDGNVMRVLTRIYGIKSDIKKAGTGRRLWAKAEQLVPSRRPGDWNQALMELGATVCLPESPLCGACPIKRHCAAFKQGLQDRLPVVGARRKPVDLRWTCLWLERDGNILLWKRGAQERFLKDHWGLPEPRHVEAEIGECLGRARHTITHHRISIALRQARLIGPKPGPARWVPKARLGDYLVSSLWLKSLPLNLRSIAPLRNTTILKSAGNSSI